MYTSYDRKSMTVIVKKKVIEQNTVLVALEVRNASWIKALSKCRKKLKMQSISLLGKHMLLKRSL